MSRIKNTVQEDRWLAEGRVAAETGKTVDDCPYKLHIMARHAWLIGWRNGGGEIITGKVKAKEE